MEVRPQNTEMQDGSSAALRQLGNLPYQPDTDSMFAVSPLRCHEQLSLS